MLEMHCKRYITSMLTHYVNSSHTVDPHNLNATDHLLLYGAGTWIIGILMPPPVVCNVPRNSLHRGLLKFPDHSPPRSPPRSSHQHSHQHSRQHYKHSKTTLISVCLHLDERCNFHCSEEAIGSQATKGKECEIRHLILKTLQLLVYVAIELAKI
jgi:hypothetical protein